MSLLPQNSFFKDQLFANKLSKPFNRGAFFPVNEYDYDLIPNINDSSDQYFKFTNTLYKKHLFELSGPDYYLTISPTFDFSAGRDLNDTTGTSLFQNTRGFYITGNFFENFSFSTSFYENQGRYTRYEREFYSALGELYPLVDSTYQTQNAVIPGSGRTKDFKTGGFDYAYAIGNVSYLLFLNMKITAGNNQQFIGDGHRSLLLSDNSYSAPYVLIDWDIHPKFRIYYMRKRLMNLMRRPATGSVESYYESKGYSVNYFTYQPIESINISLFEGTVWNRGDSITSTFSHPLIYSPIPFISSAILGDKEVNSLFGLNIGVQIHKKHRAYGQIAMNNFNADRIGFQVGYRGYNYFGLNDFMLQLEYNYIPDGMYASSNQRLSYVHYNLPLAHILGDDLQEIVVRSNYEFKRFYADFKLSHYILHEFDPRSWLPSQQLQLPTTPETYNVTNSTLELGYRFNRKMNFSCFGSITLRNSTRTDNINAQFVQLGMRTALNNHYKNF